MSCPGLHCPGCSGGQSLAIAGGTVVGLVLAAATVQWVAEHVWEVGGTVAACFALSVAVSMWLERWAEIRGQRFAERHGILSRADVIQLDTERVDKPQIRLPLADLRRPELEPRAVHLHFHGLPGPEQAAIIRQALPERTEP